MFVVGMVITCHPLHRSVRAQLPNTAPALGFIARSARAAHNFMYGSRSIATGGQALGLRLAGRDLGLGWRPQPVECPGHQRRGRGAVGG